MAYQGTTSTASNPPVLVTQGIAYASSGPRVFPRVWNYTSTHTQAELAAANFFAEGRSLGFKVGDQLFHSGSTTFLLSSHAVTVVGSTTTQVTTGVVLST
jgi:hypothetical protein